jgi:hypothetical protein
VMRRCLWLQHRELSLSILLLRSADPTLSFRFTVPCIVPGTLPWSGSSTGRRAEVLFWWHSCHASQGPRHRESSLVDGNSACCQFAGKQCTTQPSGYVLVPGQALSNLPPAPYSHPFVFALQGCSTLPYVWADQGFDFQLLSECFPYYYQATCRYLSLYNNIHCSYLCGASVAAVCL